MLFEGTQALCARLVGARADEDFAFGGVAARTGDGVGVGDGGVAVGDVTQVAQGGVGLGEGAPGGRLMLSWLKPVSARGMKPVGRSCQEAARMRTAALRVVLRWRSVHSRAC